MVLSGMLVCGALKDGFLQVVTLCALFVGNIFRFLWKC